MNYRNYEIICKWYKNGKGYVINCDGYNKIFESLAETRAFIDMLYGFE